MAADSVALSGQLDRELQKQPMAPTLWELEDSLTALLDTEAMVSAEQEHEFQVELARTMKETVAKRDRVAAFIRFCEAQAAAARVERDRLSKREQFFTSAAERMRQYVHRILEGLGGGGKPKLEGKTSTFSLRACPPSVDITNEAAVPAEFKTLTITVPAAAWEKHIRNYREMMAVLFGGSEPAEPAILQEITKSDVFISKTAIRKAIEEGRTVPGADVKVGKTTLVLS